MTPILLVEDDDSVRQTVSMFLISKATQLTR